MTATNLGRQLLSHVSTEAHKASQLHIFLMLHMLGASATCPPPHTHELIDTYDVLVLIDRGEREFAPVLSLREQANFALLIFQPWMVVA